MKNNGFLFILLLVILLFVVAVLFTPTPTNWQFTYSKYDKSPHGSFLLYEELNQIFNDAQIETPDSTIYTAVEEWKENSTAIIIITQSFGSYSSFADQTNKLDSFVNAGNQVFISANYINFNRNDSSEMGFHHIRSHINYDYNNSSYYTYTDEDEIVETKLQHSSDTTTYPVRKEYVKNTITTDSTFHYKLGYYDDDSLVNFIRVPYGKGNYYFHSNPGVFTNNAMLYDSLANYATSVLSHIEDINHIIWDETEKPYFSFMNQISQKKVTPLRFIRSNPALALAFWATIIGSVLLIFTKGKREQQAIPVIQPPKNQTVLFTKTMGRFYNEKAQHLDIAEKRMQYFELDFRKKFNIQRIDEYKGKQQELSSITGIPQEHIRTFFQRREMLNKVESLTEQQLMKVSKSIENMKTKL